MDTRSFVDAHGVEIATYWWPVTDPRAAVFISHGASEHAGRYDRFATALNAAGFTVAALDHRGHGRTAASTGVGIMGPGGGQAVIDDLDALRSQLVAEAGSVPVLFFAHSMGSLFGLAYLTQHSTGLAGAVLCGFPADPATADEFAEMMRGMATPETRDQPILGLVANSPTLENPRTAFDWLSRDDAEVDKYIADPFCGDNHPLTFGYVADFLDVVAGATKLLADVACPTLVIAGGQDPAAGMGAHARGLGAALEAAGVATETVVYEDARHELLNETNRDEVTADVIAWFEKQL